MSGKPLPRRYDVLQCTCIVRVFHAYEASVLIKEGHRFKKGDDQFYLIVTLLRDSRLLSAFSRLHLLYISILPGPGT
jgi:hypothetical protein